MVFENTQKILVFAPHPDDAEFGLGGTISKLIDQGKDIFIVVFSLCEKSTPKNFKIGTIEKEMYKSLTYLKIPKKNIHLYNFTVREFPSARQAILEEMIIHRNKINPDMVFIPCSSDVHQDHKVIHEEGRRAFKFNNLLGYTLYICPQQYP